VHAAAYASPLRFRDPGDQLPQLLAHHLDLLPHPGELIDQGTGRIRVLPYGLRSTVVLSVTCFVP
jgi:hypothetical protein